MLFCGFHSGIRDAPECVSSGRSAAWLARLVRDQEAGGSNPLAPTTLSRTSLYPQPSYNEQYLRANREIALVHYAGLDRPRRFPAKKAQEVLTGHCSHLGLVRLQSSWPWRFSSKYARTSESNFCGISASMAFCASRYVAP